MQLSMQGKAIIKKLKDGIEKVKSEEGIKQLIIPTIDIFYTSIASPAKQKLKSSLVATGLDDGEYNRIVEQYKLVQIEHLFACIDAILKFLQTLIDSAQATDLYVNKLLDFIVFEQLSTITLDFPATIVDKLNVAIKFRLIYFLTDHVYSTLSQFRSGHNIIASQNYDQNILKKIDKVTEESVLNQEKRPHVNLLFYSELSIREASVMALGDLLRNDQVMDIFLVYKSTAFGLSDLRQQDASISYYNLAVKTLTQLSKASKLMQPQHAGQQLSVVIQPMNQETAIGHHGLVQRSVFGVNISFQDTNGLILDVTASPGFNHVYQVEPHYKLNPSLKFAYLSHIKLLTVQLSDSPTHSHKKRRQEKLAALEYIVNADNRSELTPATFEQAKVGKPYLFVAWHESETQKLIEYGESEIKAKLWLEFSKKSQSIGCLGYSISNEDLVAKLQTKYLSLSQDVTYNPSQKIQDLLNQASARLGKTGYDLWRFDKKTALEIVLVAHSQQLLHPALIKKIEKKFPMIYARSFWNFRKSEVENLMLELKQNIIDLLWHDAANDIQFQASSPLGVN